MLIPRRETARTRVVRYRDSADAPRKVDDALAGEEPMEIRVTHRPVESGVNGPSLETVSVAVTMRTPGDDFELAAGFLFTEGLIRDRREVDRITYCSGDEPQEYNLVEVRLRPGSGFDPRGMNRNFYMTSSCGICGKASLDAVEAKGCAPFPSPEQEDALPVRPAVVRALPDTLREAQPVFSRTGGLHAAGLFDEEGALLGVREDVGRHNAVDKLVGNAFLEGRTPLSGTILTVSGRASFEILQKALMAGIPFLVAVGAPSSLAVDFARRFRMTLVGFARGDGFNVYSGEDRIEGGGAAG